MNRYTKLKKDFAKNGSNLPGGVASILDDMERDQNNLKTRVIVGIILMIGLGIYAFNYLSNGLSSGEIQHDIGFFIGQILNGIESGSK